MGTMEGPDGETDLLPSSLNIQCVRLRYNIAKVNQFRSPLKLFDIARAEGRPLYGAAPMVRYSKVHAKINSLQLLFLLTGRFTARAKAEKLQLAFRETVAYYSTDLTFTPMVCLILLFCPIYEMRNLAKRLRLPRFWQRNSTAASSHVIVVGT